MKKLMLIGLAAMMLSGCGMVGQRIRNTVTANFVGIERVARIYSPVTGELIEEYRGKMSIDADSSPAIILEFSTGERIVVANALLIVEDAE